MKISSPGLHPKSGVDSKEKPMPQNSKSSFCGGLNQMSSLNVAKKYVLVALFWEKYVFRLLQKIVLYLALSKNLSS